MISMLHNTVFVKTWIPGIFSDFFNTHLNHITGNLALSSRYFAYLLYFYFQETMANGITITFKRPYEFLILSTFYFPLWKWLVMWKPDYDFFIAAIHDLSFRSLESVMTCHLIWSYLNRNSDISIQNHENQQAHITLLAGLTFSSE